MNFTYEIIIAGISIFALSHFVFLYKFANPQKENNQEAIQKVPNQNKEFQVCKLENGHYVVIHCWPITYGKFCHPLWGKAIVKFANQKDAEAFANENNIDWYGEK